MTTNPKDLIGSTKPQLWLIPSAGTIETAMAFKNGADKYGAYNWREHPVRLTVYIDAALRHLSQLLDGEDKASDSNIHHAAHVAACMYIILDSLHTGGLVDDRPKPGAASRLIEQYTKKKGPVEGPSVLTDKEFFRLCLLYQFQRIPI
jgi:hypothetical protein